MQLTTLSSPPQAYYVVLRPIIDKFEVTFETSETSWAQIINAQKAIPSKNLLDGVDDPLQPTIIILCGSETY